VETFKSKSKAKKVIAAAGAEWQVTMLLHGRRMWWWRQPLNAFYGL
jgi:hypothetical protein